jgi:hypothetical protein
LAREGRGHRDRPEFERDGNKSDLGAEEPVTVGYSPDRPGCAAAANVVECVNSDPSH